MATRPAVTAGRVTEDSPEPDIGAAEEAAPSYGGVDDAPFPQRPQRISRRTLGISIAVVAIVAVIVIDVAYMFGASKRGAPPAKSARASSTVTFEDPPSVAAVPIDSSEAKPEAPPAKQQAEKKPRSDRQVRPGTVQDAAARTCSTASVDALSGQIIRQARCIDPKAFVPVPPRPNLVTAKNVFLYMDAAAKDHLLRALDANKKKTMNVNSALRTVAQQYLLYRWAQRKRCGIELASAPGESNHETGLALDISEPGTWRTALEKENFRWLGNIDKVHFDYVGTDAASRSSVDVKAFQQLWNKNHPEDLISESGRYRPETEERLEKSPTAGFPLGPSCKRANSAR